MNYKEVQGDLFKGLHERDGLVESLTDTKEVYCHCIANDGKWGAGIAPVFIDKIFNFNFFLSFMILKKKNVCQENNTMHFYYRQFCLQTLINFSF